MVSIVEPAAPSRERVLFLPPLTEHSVGLGITKVLPVLEQVYINCQLVLVGAAPVTVSQLDSQRPVDSRVAKSVSKRTLKPE